MFFLLALAACGDLREGGGTAVGNPTMTALRMAPSGTMPWEEATAAIDLTLRPCGLGELWQKSLGSIDLIEGPAVELPVGTWCTLELQIRDLAALGEVPVEVAQAEVVLDVAGVLEGGDRVLELGEPSTPAGFAQRSGLYTERVVDRRIDSIERSAGPVAAGPERTPDPEEPSVMMVVGAEGFRSPQLEEPGLYDFDDGGEAFLDVAHHDGVWVTVGSYSGVRSAASTDYGQTWTDGDLASGCSSVHWRDGEFIAPSRDGGIFVTQDGVSWTRIHSSGVSLAAAVSSPTRTVVVGNEAVLFADDARTWTRIDLLGSGRFRDVAWSSAAGFVAVGPAGLIYHSPDGESWTDVSPGTTDLNAVVWTGTRFVTVGASESWFSTDGRSWTAGSPKSLNDVGVHDGRLFAVTGAFIDESLDDGETWVRWRTLDVPWLVGIGSNRP